MSITEVQQSKNLNQYLSTQSTLFVYLGVKEITLESTLQLTTTTYILSFRNTKAKILLNTQVNQLEKNYLIAQKLAAANFPVLKPLFYCQEVSVIGTPFYASEYIEGRAFDNQKFISLSQNEKTQILREISKTLAHLHSISLNYWGFENVSSQTSQYQVNNKKLYNLYKIHETKISTNVEDLLYWLELNNPVQSQADNLCLVHGDFTLSKIIFHQTEPKIIAVLNWESAQLGNSLTDFASFLTKYYIPYSNGQQAIDGWSGVESLIGVPTLQEVMTSYFGTRSITTIPDIRYQIIQAILKEAINQQILFKQLKEAKYLKNSEFLSKAGYDIVLQVTEGDPFGIKMRATTDGSLWSKWPVSERAQSVYYRVKDFMRDEIFPIEKSIIDKARKFPQTVQNKGFPEVEALQRKAKAQGLWNLFISDPMYGKGLTNLEYVFISELMGLSYLAHETFNCFAPETGNIKLLIGYGSPYQKEKYLKPLIEGECKSFFAMTEKNVASSDPNNYEFTITPVEGGYLLNGSKYMVASAPDERAVFGIVMGKSDKQAHPMEQQSMIIVDMPNPNIKIIRQISVFQFFDIPHGYAEVNFENVFVPKENLLGPLGGAFKMAQGRLLGGRLHHCVRQIGLTRRCMDLMLSRAEQRTMFKQKLKDNAAFAERLGKLEIEFQNCRLLSLNSGLLLDSAGSKHLHTFMAVSQCKAHVPKACQDIIDACIQAFGAEGVTEDQPLALHWRFARAIRFMDGPCEVHLRQIARFAYGNHMFNDLNNAQGYGLAKL